ncbi:hypothetical protein RND81_05G097800 [Saponaria officinalis]|uniref:F-box domain-containing protein n=1 Tax=Saponaria officinalis TaxID=3572 RepID=A0AAW1KW91_SAPOF
MESHFEEEKCPIQQTELPHDLITHSILARLPVKPLVRFKSVSKLWYSTLSSPQFALAHFSFPHPSSTESLLIKSNDNFKLLSYESGEHDARIHSDCEMKVHKIEVDFAVGDEKLVLVGSCNGLVCLGSISGRLFIIWNPITREFRQYSNLESDKLVGWMVTWGFRYVSAVDDYKVIRICKKLFVGSIRVHVFSLRSNKWRRIDDDPSHNFSDLKTTERLHKPRVLVNETLYWMGGVPSMLEGVQRKIFSFYLALELFDTFPHLEVSTPSTWVLGEERFDEFICVIKGCLAKYGRLIKRGDGYITILRSPGETVQILLPRDLISSVCQNVIGFTRSDKFFTQYYRSHVPHLGMIDPTSRPMKHTSLMYLERWSKNEIVGYSASLISPAAVTGTPEFLNS